MLRAMFNSDFFKSESSRFARIKSPAEVVIGTLRLTGSLDLPNTDTYVAAATSAAMGQNLLNPPSVEGWQGGDEWINTGSYVQRINYASRILNDPDRPGIRSIINRIKDSANGGSLTAEQLVDQCLDILGPLPVVETTRAGLIDYASKRGDISFADEDSASSAEKNILIILQLIVTTQEYQLA